MSITKCIVHTLPLQFMAALFAHFMARAKRENRRTRTTFLSRRHTRKQRLEKKLQRATAQTSVCICATGRNRPLPIMICCESYQAQLQEAYRTNSGADRYTRGERERREREERERERVTHHNLAKGTVTTDGLQTAKNMRPCTACMS